MIDVVNTASPPARDSRHRGSGSRSSSPPSSPQRSGRLCSRRTTPASEVDDARRDRHAPGARPPRTAGRGRGRALARARRRATAVRDRPLLRLDLASGAVQQTDPPGRAGLVTSTHVGDRLLASVEHVGGDGSGPSLVVALDWRSGGVLVAQAVPDGAVGPLARGGKDLWALAGPTRRAPPPRSGDARCRPRRRSRSRAAGRSGSPSAPATSGPRRRTRARCCAIDPATRAIKRVHVGGLPGRDRGRRRERLGRRPRARRGRPARPADAPTGRRADPRRRRAGVAGGRRPLPLRRRRRRAGR